MDYDQHIAFEGIHVLAYVTQLGRFAEDMVNAGVIQTVLSLVDTHQKDSVVLSMVRIDGASLPCFCVCVCVELHNSVALTVT